LKAVEEYSLKEINKIEDEKLREQYKKMYEYAIQSLISTPFDRRIRNYYPDVSIREFERILERETIEHTSFYNLPNQLVCFYPTLKEQSALSNQTCAFSGSKIKNGSLYYCYRPLLDVVNSNCQYVLKKTIKVETAYFSDLPRTIQEFDIFAQKVENYWNYPNDIVDYEQINYYLGGAVELLKLNKKRKIKR